MFFRACAERLFLDRKCELLLYSWQIVDACPSALSNNSALPQASSIAAVLFAYVTRHCNTYILTLCFRSFFIDNSKKQRYNKVWLAITNRMTTVCRLKVVKDIKKMFKFCLKMQDSDLWKTKKMLEYSYAI